jgi:HSP20 family protein
MKEQTAKTTEYVDYVPSADIIDNHSAVKLYLDLPGATKDCLDINIEDRVLRITADTGIIYRGKNLRYNRSFSISDEIDTGKISAKMSDGVLEMILSKANSAKPLKIAVTG